MYFSKWGHRITTINTLAPEVKWQIKYKPSIDSTIHIDEKESLLKVGSNDTDLFIY